MSYTATEIGISLYSHCRWRRVTYYIFNYLWPHTCQGCQICHIPMHHYISQHPICYWSLVKTTIPNFAHLKPQTSLSIYKYDTLTCVCNSRQAHTICTLACGVTNYYPNNCPFHLTIYQQSLVDKGPLLEGTYRP